MVFPFLDVASLSDDPLRGVTPRVRELLAALARGRTNAQLARDLDISLNFTLRRRGRPLPGPARQAPRIPLMYPNG